MPLESRATHLAPVQRKIGASALPQAAAAKGQPRTLPLMRIHITGASGSGTTTLGAALARDLGCPQFDGDDYFWLPTSPPFRTRRPAAERVALLRRDMTGAGSAVISGSIMGWGQDVEDAFDLIVFLYLPASVRVERLRARELQRHGMTDPAFLEWAAQYDAGPPEGRSLARHSAWLAGRRCPVLRLAEDESVAQRLARVRQALGALDARDGEPPARPA